APRFTTRWESLWNRGRPRTGFEAPEHGPADSGSVWVSSNDQGAAVQFKRCLPRFALRLELRACAGEVGPIGRRADRSRPPPLVIGTDLHIRLALVGRCHLERVVSDRFQFCLTLLEPEGFRWLHLFNTSRRMLAGGSPDVLRLF